MSWASRGTVASKKKRIATIEKRTFDTEMPPLEVLFSTFVKEGNAKITKDLVDKVYFSSFPSKDASSALSALSMNVKNIDGMRKSGSLGVVVEMLRRIDFSTELDENHIADLVRSVSILTEDEIAQNRLLSNSHACESILKLCVHTHGAVQEKIFHVLDRLCRQEYGFQTFLKHNVFGVLLTPEMLYCRMARQSVRNGAAQLINRLAAVAPDKFPVELMENILIVNGARMVDGYIEMQLLNALLSHLTWLSNEKHVLYGCSSLLIHMVDEIKDEKFEDLEHLLQLLKCLMIISRDLTQGNFLLHHDLNIALQYVVRTDFELWRKSLDTYKRRPQSSHGGSSGGGSSGSIGGRPQTSGMQSTLSAIRGIRQTRTRKTEDINYKTTRLVVLIYENVLKLGVHVIGGIVSSGLISGLLFRVGKGKNIDKRFHKLVIHFLFQILVKVALDQPVHNRPMSVIGIAPRQSEYTRGGSRRSVASARIAAMGSNLASKTEAVTVRTVSNKLHAQGVTDLLIFCLEGDDYEVVADAMTSLASMHFPVIKNKVINEYILGKICGYSLTRRDCFFSGLALVCEAIMSPPADHFPGMINVLVDEFNIINVLIRSMKLSGWIFNMKVGTGFTVLIEYTYGFTETE